MSSVQSRELYAEFLKRIGSAHHPDKIKGSVCGTEALDGVFGAMMQVGIVNDGPVTIQLDSRKFEYK